MAVDQIHPALNGAKLENTKAGQLPQGVEVVDVEGRSPASAVGLRKGDIITGVNRVKVDNLNALEKAMKGRTDVLALNVIRGNASLYLILR